MGLITETHPSDRKALSGTLRSAVRLDPPLYSGLIKPSIKQNSDDNDDDDDDDDDYDDDDVSMMMVVVIILNM